ncbi:CoA-disulfide reductase [Enterovibrio norvegicus FF-162]|uniref:CoA-disulfide reductase n=1 Tax=Enterovibrio norvegicus TaxID=188144 RepID=UPI0002ED3D44|nr:CoA-disulfide reductase [Enterovibrio norvegicus]OEE87574.1 CoA-disulfide reductase [Enterovibrio norvegicus FF-162]
MKIIIIGGEAAGMSAAAKARRVNPSAEIIVYEASEIISFGACGLPYYVADEFSDSGYMSEFTPAQFAERGITVNTGHRVTKVDANVKKLEISHNDEVFVTHYDRLMIATGAREVLPPVEGLEKNGVHTLRVMNDGIALKAATQDANCQHVTIIGSGFIGLEVAEAMLHQGKQVRLIERAERLIPDAFDAEISVHIHTELEKAGVEILTSESLMAIKGDTAVSGVITDKGEYATDLVVVCTGVKPNTAFLQETGIETLPNGAIVVDREGKTSLPDVWSAGDCAAIWNSISQRNQYIPLATGANKLGRLVGDNIAQIDGEPLQFPGSLGTSCVRILGLEAGRTGLSEREATDAGFMVKTLTIKDKCHTNYCAGQSDMHMKLIYEAETKRILGAQLIGYKGAVHRIDAMAVAITMGVTTSQLGMMDFAYAPPFARTWDIMNVAGNVAK